MYAIAEIFKNQFFIKKNNIVITNKINVNINSKIESNNVLLFNNNNKLYIGNPYLNNIKIVFLVVNHFKGKKIKILKFKRRKNYLKRMSIINFFTRLKVIEIYY